MPDAFTTVHRQLIILSQRGTRCPAIYPYRYEASKAACCPTALMTSI